MTDDISLEALRRMLCDERSCIEHGNGTSECPVPTDRSEIDDSSRYEYQPGTDVMDIEPVEVPSESNCPSCGAEPTEESIAKHRLSDMGYIHDDVQMKCSADSCDTEWTLGLPIGDFDGGNDLHCDSCDSSRYLVHRVDVRLNDDEADPIIHLKCPNCFHFKTVERETDDKGIALIGYPDITGSTDDAQAYGYTDAPPQ